MLQWVREGFRVFLVKNLGESQVRYMGRKGVSGAFQWYFRKFQRTLSDQRCFRRFRKVPGALQRIRGGITRLLMAFLEVSAISKGSGSVTKAFPGVSESFRYITWRLHGIRADFRGFPEAF